MNDSVTRAAVEHRLGGAIEKFNRSKELFDQLLAEMDAFFNADPTPHYSVGAFDHDAWEWVERFQVRTQPPLRFGVILGDCVHNLRCALDHIVWQVTLLDGGSPNYLTQYPIASESEAQFERMAKKQIPRLSERHRAMILKTQPYHRGANAKEHPLSMLAHLSNVDKHRVVHAAYNSVGWDAGETLDRLIASAQQDSSPVVGWYIAKSGALEHGTPWFRIVWSRDEEPPVKVDISGDITTEISFGEIAMPAAEFNKIADAVRTILEAFMREFPETQYTD